MNGVIKEQKNIYKLRKMRLIATGLLVIMAVTYLVFKRLESSNMFFSAIAAFSEAAMVGALADWFAVVALFRHPLGIKWIPHTAIVQNNKERIGESLSQFVVVNFFTDEVIKAKLESFSITEEITDHLIKYKDSLLNRMTEKLPKIVNTIFSNREISGFIGESVNNKIAEIKLYPLVGSSLDILVASGQHMPLVKEVLISLYNYISDNKERTLKTVEGINRTLALPIIGEIVYKNILKVLLKQIDNLENDPESEINKLLLYSLPRLIERLKTSDELIEKGEKLKCDILDSEWFNNFIKKVALDTKNSVIQYSENSRNELKKKLDSLVDIFLKEVLSSEKTKYKIEEFIKNSVVKLVCKYREEISRLILDTIRNWEAGDMTRKLEAQVGADLQYIRINGTIIGGLAGLAIHIISHI